MKLQMFTARRAEGFEADRGVDAESIGGRSLSPTDGTMALVFMVEQPLGMEERKHRLDVELLDADLRPVTPAEALVPFHVALEFVIPKPADHTAGEPLRKSLTMTLGTMTISPGAYLWRGTLDQTVAEWSFVVR